MRVISIWQPYASLLVGGFKRIETRPFPAPSTIVGQRIGIASTKVIRSEQRAAFEDPIFAGYYAQTGLPAFDDLPHGFLLGTVLMKTTDPITDEDIDDITEEEQCYGWFEPGRHAWRTLEPEVFPEPIPVRGAQGIWIWEPAKVHNLSEAR